MHLRVRKGVMLFRFFYHPSRRFFPKPREQPARPSRIPRKDSHNRRQLEATQNIGRDGARSHFFRIQL